MAQKEKDLLEEALRFERMEMRQVAETNAWAEAQANKEETTPQAEEERNPLRICQNCGGVCDPDTDWCGHC